LVAVFGIGAADEPSAIMDDLPGHPTPYKRLFGKGTTVQKDYKPPSTPFVYIINRDGTIKESRRSYTFDALKVILDDMLKPPVKK
jgi:hypothetical protein